jgi:phospholipase/carboxylesterase
MHSIQNTLRFGRPLKDARGAAILIHGRGSSAADIAGLARALDASDFAFLAPSATRGSWYPQRFLAPLSENEPQLSSALQTIEALVQEAVAAGVPRQRVALLGFSQGACLVLEHVYRTGGGHAFAAALSGALIGPLDTPRPGRDLQRMPILLGCAEEDAHIPREHVEHSGRVLAGMNAAVNQQIYPGSAHTVFPEEIAWINARFAEVQR